MVLYGKLYGRVGRCRQSYMRKRPTLATALGVFVCTADRATQPLAGYFISSRAIASLTASSTARVVRRESFFDVTSVLKLTM